MQITKMCKNQRILKIDIFRYVTNRKCIKYPENTYRMQNNENVQK